MYIYIYIYTHTHTHKQLRISSFSHLSALHQLRAQHRPREISLEDRRHTAHKDHLTPPKGDTTLNIPRRAVTRTFTLPVRTFLLRQRLWRRQTTFPCPRAHQTTSHHTKTLRTSSQQPTRLRLRLRLRLRIRTTARNVCRLMTSPPIRLRGSPLLEARFRVSRELFPRMRRTALSCSLYSRLHRCTTLRPSPTERYAVACDVLRRSLCWCYAVAL
jgi:hypothetical protein